MSRYKLKVSIVTFVFMGVVWYFQNSSYIDVYADKYKVSLDKFNELLFYMNGSAFGYSSIQNYSLVYLIPFLLLLQQFMGNDEEFLVIRHANRNKLYNMEFKNILLTSITIAITHSVVNVLGSFIYFNNNLVFDSNIIYYSFIHSFVLMLFYMQIGLIFSLIKIVSFSNSIAMIGTLLIVAGTFFISKILLPSVWTPLLDLDLLMKLIEKQYTIQSISWIYLKQCVCVAVLYLIGSLSYSRKDYL
ncbi:WxPxxD family membrane protein [Pontibacillus litoralis]|uniref:Uncharacterized protein n=1 Tax=Pontibacillus litoralis JSM 072002 TaxID=1385512 RepID=A0A0A5G9E7_9BACI|nr:WxPxxD family membrane protein [Pontibacillus litoralis]KGX87803.1 hypothetical protein N784_13825 [Pontibacillus litoralis JSM 072002]